MAAPSPQRPPARPRPPVLARSLPLPASISRLERRGAALREDEGSGHVGSFRVLLVRGVLRESAQGKPSLGDRRKVGLEAGGVERLLRL